MFDITTDDLMAVYDQLKDRYPLVLTNTFALDDGFEEDMPIICGEACGRKFWLYEHGGDFVFSAEIPGKDYHNHWHPEDVETAVEDVTEFMEGNPRDTRRKPWPFSIFSNPEKS